MLDTPIRKATSTTASIFQRNTCNQKLILGILCHSELAARKASQEVPMLRGMIGENDCMSRLYVAIVASIAYFGPVCLGPPPRAGPGPPLRANVWDPAYFGPVCLGPFPFRTNYRPKIDLVATIKSVPPGSFCGNSTELCSGSPPGPGPGQGRARGPNPAQNFGRTKHLK